MQRRLMANVGGIDVGAAVDQQAHQGLVTLNGGEMQRRLEGNVDGVDVGAALDQHLGHGQVAAPSCQMQWRAIGGAVGRCDGRSRQAGREGCWWQLEYVVRALDQHLGHREPVAPCCQAKETELEQCHLYRMLDRVGRWVD